MTARRLRGNRAALDPKYDENDETPPPRPPVPLGGGRSTAPIDAARYSGGRSTAPVDPARYIGTHQWQRRRRYLAERQGKNYSPEREIKHIYRHLDLWHALVDRVNASSETATGKELSAALINYLDLELAMRSLPSLQQRECWNLAIVGRQRVYDRASGQWRFVPVPRLTYAEVADALGLTEKAVRNTISLATAFIVTFLYDPE